MLIGLGWSRPQAAEVTSSLLLQLAPGRTSHAGLVTGRSAIEIIDRRTATGLLTVTGMLLTYAL
jgi:hypothetical protein